MKESQTVSTIIPAYNAAKTIGRAVECVLAQTYHPAEILVIDDGSPDELAMALVPYQHRIRLIQKSNGGAASARNVGIDNARGDLIAFLDADDYWEPRKLELQVEIFRSHPEVGLVATRFFEQLPAAKRVEVVDGMDADHLDRVLRAAGSEAFALAIQAWTGTIMVRRSVLGNHRFVSGLEPAEDRDLWVRLIASNPVYFLSARLATAVLKPDSLSRSNLDVDCSNMLKVARRYRDLLGRCGLRCWEAHIFKRWAGNHLVQGRPRSALPYAWRRLQLQPFSPEAWWIVLKSIVLGLGEQIPSRKCYRLLGKTANGDR